MLTDVLDLSRPFRIARDNLDSIAVYRVRIVKFEVDVFDDEGPHFVAEAVCVEMSLAR
jgi:hypothetical protein